MSEYNSEPIQPLESLYQSLYKEGRVSLPSEGLSTDQMLNEIADLLKKAGDGSALCTVTYCSIARGALQPVSQAYEQHISPRPLNYNDLTDDDKLSALRSFVAEQGLELRTEDWYKFDLKIDD
jgi:hypothetical protein